MGHRVAWRQLRRPCQPSNKPGPRDPTYHGRVHGSSGCRRPRRRPGGAAASTRRLPERRGRACRFFVALTFRRALLVAPTVACSSAAVGAGRRSRELHARSPFDAAPASASPPPPAHRQGPRGLRLGRGARTASHARRCASGRRTARPAGPRRRPRRRTGGLGPLDVQRFYGWSSIRRAARNVVVIFLAWGGAACSRGRRPGARRPRRPGACRRALGARGAVDRAGGVLRLPPGPTREHPQRQPPGHGWSTSPRHGSALPGSGWRGRRANARRAAP